MTDIPTPRRGRPPKYAHLSEEELRELARKQAAERQARKRGRDQAEAAATEMVLRTLSDALLYSAKEGLVDPVALLDTLKVGRARPTKPEVEAGIDFGEAERLWTRFKRVFLEALAEGRGSLIPPGVGDPLADPTDEEWQTLVHPTWQGYFPNGREDAKIRFLSRSAASAPRTSRSAGAAGDASGMPRSNHFRALYLPSGFPTSRTTATSPPSIGNPSGRGSAPSTWLSEARPAKASRAPAGAVGWTTNGGS